MTTERLMTLSGAIEPTMVRISPRTRPRVRANHLICYIDVSAFLAVILVVLIIFMTPTADLPRAPGVDLAKVASSIRMRAANKEDAMIVAVERDGGVFYRMDKIRVEDLASKIREGLGRGAENKAYIKADARAKYGDVKEVLDSIHAARVEKIAILVDQRRRSLPPE